MQFLSYFHDPDDLFVPLLQNIKIPPQLNGSIVAITPETTATVYELVKSLGFKIIEGGPYGYARIKVLQTSLKLQNGTQFFVCDFDKLIHWLLSNQDEFLTLFNTEFKSDLVVVARSPKALETYPKSWIQTETIVSEVIEKILGGSFDIMNGPYILNKKAAEIIAYNAKETQVGSCSEWALIAKLAGLSLENHEVDGLTWEDPDRYAEFIKEFENFDVWKNKTYDSLYEWRKRVEFLHAQVKVMIRLTEEPVNPKYPFVHNQTFA